MPRVRARPTRGGGGGAGWASWAGSGMSTKCHTAGGARARSPLPRLGPEARPDVLAGGLGQPVAEAPARQRPADLLLDPPGAAAGQHAEEPHRLPAAGVGGGQAQVRVAISQLLV